MARVSCVLGGHSFRGSNAVVASVTLDPWPMQRWVQCTNFYCGQFLEAVPCSQSNWGCLESTTFCDLDSTNRRDFCLLWSSVALRTFSNGGPTSLPTLYFKSTLAHTKTAIAGEKPTYNTIRAPKDNKYKLMYFLGQLYTYDNPVTHTHLTTKPLLDTVSVFGPRFSTQPAPPQACLCPHATIRAVSLKDTVRNHKPPHSLDYLDWIYAWARQRPKRSSLFYKDMLCLSHSLDSPLLCLLSVFYLRLK